ncbi:MAG: hypothetical protein J0H15_13010 [Xanthomonadales bacterium]|nr:hypothetical protein [Xanthomonadales bacterium]
MNRNLLLLLALFANSALAADPPPLAEVKGNTTGYSSVGEALAALRSDPDVVEREQQGWLLFEDRRSFTLWSFPPKSHSAYPSAVKRTVVKKDGGMYVNMSVQCGASKEACDQLVRDFQQLNEQMTREIQADKAGQIE